LNEVVKVLSTEFKLDLFSSVSPDDKVALTKVVQNSPHLATKEVRMNQEVALFRRGINKRMKELPSHK
jgi:hypothetical protein